MSAEDATSVPQQNETKNIELHEKYQKFSYTTDAPYLFISSFSEPLKKTPGRPRSEKSYNSSAQKSAGKAYSSKQQSFTVQMPDIAMITIQGESYPYRCVCGEVVPSEFDIECDSCKVWLHANCVNLNQHTVPENYSCPKCSRKVIRCKCERNMLYKLALIRCTVCGNYSHKQCVDINYGPLPIGEFVCSFCSNIRKYVYTFPYIKIPENLVFEEKTFTFTADWLENLQNQYRNSPFSDIITTELTDKTLLLTDFCEIIFNKCKSFFFLCHPLLDRNKTSSLKKKNIDKRGRMIDSFISVTLNLLQTLYEVNESVIYKIFDSLLHRYIYIPNIIPDKTDISSKVKDKVEVTQNCNDILKDPTPMLDPILFLNSMPDIVDVDINSDGVFAKYDMQSDQLIGLVYGLVGDIEEFNYEDGVNESFYQIYGTRFVLDSRYVSDNILTKFNRSMKGNCVLKLFRANDKENKLYCGIFICNCSLRNGWREDLEIFKVSSGEELTLAIDFIPAKLEDIPKYWQWINESESLSPSTRSTRQQRLSEGQSRFVDHKVKREKRKINKEIKNRIKHKIRVEPVNDMTLFDIFESEETGPLPYIFTDSPLRDQFSIQVVPSFRGRIQTNIQPTTKVKRMMIPSEKADDNDREEEEEEKKEEVVVVKKVGRRGRKPKYQKIKDEKIRHRRYKDDYADQDNGKEEEEQELEVKHGGEKNEHKKRMLDSNNEDFGESDSFSVSISQSTEENLLRQVRINVFKPFIVGDPANDMLSIMGL